MIYVPAPVIAEQLLLCARALESRGWDEESDFLRRIAQSQSALGGGVALPSDAEGHVTEEALPTVHGPDEMTMEEQLLADRENEDDFYGEPFNMLSLEDTQGDETLLHGSEGASFLAQQGGNQIPPATWGAKLRAR